MKSKMEPTPAVSYIRMSTDRQEESPEQQQAEVAKLAKKYNCRIIREYFDKGISGDATEKRKAFLEMLRDAEEKRDFSVILCWDMDRFGRFDSIEAGKWIYPLRKAGVWLITVAQGQIDWNDFTSRMMYTLQQEGKHQFLVDLSRNVLRGRIASAKRGGLIVKPPYAYDRVFFDATGAFAKRVPYSERFNKPAGWTVKLAPAADTQEVETVRWLFDQFANTERSVRSLVVELNQRGILTRRGGQWSTVSVEYLLNHPVYIGVMAFGRRRGGKYYQVGPDGDLMRSNGKPGRGAPILIEGAHEPLVDAETFRRVHEKFLERRKTGYRPRYNGYILSGVLRCGHCRRKMSGSAGGGRKYPDIRYYTCPGTNDGVCHSYSVRQADIDAYVLDKLHEILFSSEAVDGISRSIHQRLKGQNGFKATVDRLKSQLAAMVGKIAKGTDNLLLAKPDDYPEMSARLAEWKAERNKLQAELERLAASPDGATEEQRVARAVKELHRLRKHLEGGKPANVRAVIRGMVQDITLLWQPHGSRYFKLVKGEMTLRSDLGVLEDSSSTVWFHRPTESGGP